MRLRVWWVLTEEGVLILVGMLGEGRMMVVFVLGAIAGKGLVDVAVKRPRCSNLKTGDTKSADDRRPNQVMVTCMLTLRT
jgi:hypothetical protein